VIIASSQIRDFTGLRVDDVPADFIEKFQVYLTHYDKATPAAVIIGVVSFLLIMVLKRRAPKIPGYLIAVIGSALAVYFLHLPVETIGSRFPDIPHGLPVPRMPDWSADKFIEVIPSAFTIAFLAGIEALLSATVADGMTCNKHRCNQELVGQGVANIMSVFFGGLPATGAIARTATNIHAGGRTPVAGIMHAVFLLLFMLFAMDAMRFVPLAALAAILLVVSWYMSESKHFIRHLKERDAETLAMLVTFFLTVLVDLTVGIFSGVAVTVVAGLYRKYRKGNTPAG
jgi:SulP family sulfate permease